MKGFNERRSAGEPAEGEFIYRDIAACFLALANALAAKGVMTKTELAQAAQERLLALLTLWPEATEKSFPLLHELAIALERKAGD
jgi:hypothetical protein